MLQCSSESLYATVVLFRAGEEDLSTLISTVRATVSEIGKFLILCSGSFTDHERLRGLIDNSGIRERVEVDYRFDNLGFSGGHNLLLDRAFASPRCILALVLNADLQISSGSVGALLGIAGGRQAGNILGPSLMLSVHEADSLNGVVDTLGIVWSQAGRHFDSRQGDPYFLTPGKVHQVSGVSGACMLVSREVFTRMRSVSGYFFDDSYLAYREDAELGVRASLLGLGSLVIETPGFVHSRSLKKGARGNPILDLLGVKNRFLLRFGLGRDLPGSAAATFLRDILVIGACLIQERGSIAGLREAFLMRRYARNATWRKRASYVDS